MDWVDPARDADGMLAALDASARGLDFDEVVAEREKELAAAADSTDLLNLQAALQEIVDNTLEAAGVSIALHRRGPVTEIVLRTPHHDGGRGIGLFCDDQFDIGKTLAKGLARLEKHLDIDPGLTWSAWVAGRVSVGTRWPNTGQVIMEREALCDLSDLPESFTMATGTSTGVGAFGFLHQPIYQEAESTMFCETEADDIKEEQHDEAGEGHLAPHAKPALPIAAVVDGETHVHHVVVEAEPISAITHEIIRGDSIVPNEERFSVPIGPTTVRAVLITASICVAVMATAFFGTVGFLAYALIK